MKSFDHSAFALAQPWGLPEEWEGRGETHFALLDPAALDAADHARWDRLGDLASSANVFTAPWAMRASLAHCDAAGRVRLAVVGDLHDEWLGVLPVLRAAHYGRVPYAHWQAWHHPNMFDGTPLVRAGQETEFWRVLFAGLGGQAPASGVLRLFNLPCDEPATAALFALCEQAGHAMKIDRRFARATLASGRARLKGDQQRRLAALRRKLERELGPTTVDILRDSAAIARAIPDFLELEHRGWKGKGGSALACQSATLGFFTDICTAGAERGFFELAVLRARGKPLAMLSYFLHRGQGYGFKMAFDPAFAAYAPGVLLLDTMTDHFAQMPLSGFDSCCAPGQKPVEALWAGRRELVDCGVAMGGLFGQSSLRLLDMLDVLRSPKGA